jgi:hypothetical protein
MTVTTMSRSVARLGRWSKDPSKGLAWTWLAAAILLFYFAPLDVAVGFVGISFLACWLSMLLVAAVIPPPAKLTELSALAARLMGFVKVVWSAFVFAAGAVYGGVTGVAVSDSGAWLSSGGITACAQAFILPLVSLVAMLVGWYALMACAYDLWRTGEDQRATSLDNVIAKLPHDLKRLPAMTWIRQVVLACSCGWLPWLLGYLGPLMLIGLISRYPRVF